MTMRGNDGEWMDRKEESSNGTSGDIIIINKQHTATTMQEFTGESITIPLQFSPNPRLL